LTTLTAWKFDTPEGASAAEAKLEALAKEGLIAVEDAAVVTWQPGKKSPKTQQSASLTGAGALGGAFWGMLFGLLFFVPLLGLALGAASGAIAGSLADVGIDDEFISSVRSEITPGTSALFVLSSHAVFDKVQDAFSDTPAQLLHSNLSKEDEARLREVFAAA
jgi:uncharacterized membrane protein